MTVTATQPRTRQRVASLKLDDVMYGRIQRLAEARRRTPHWVMKELIASGLEREEAEEEFKQAALASWQEFQRTGMHATLGEVAAWMRSWGTDEELPMPCHT